MYIFDFQTFFQGINFIIPIRMTKEEEIFGADFNEHDIRHDGYDYNGMINTLLNQGFKLHSINRDYYPPRSEWDDYLIVAYLLDTRHARDLCKNRWEQSTQNRNAVTTVTSRVEKRTKKFMKECTIS